MAQQTAVQFLVMKYHQRQGYIRFEDIEKAKEMEKEQIMKANLDGFNECANYEEKSSEQYYNENYDNNK